MDSLHSRFLNNAKHAQFNIKSYHHKAIDNIDNNKTIIIIDTNANYKK